MNDPYSLTYLSSTVQLFPLEVRGHSTTKWTKLYSIMTPHPPRVDKNGHFTYNLYHVTPRGRSIILVHSKLNLLFIFRLPIYYHHLVDVWLWSSITLQCHRLRLPSVLLHQGKGSTGHQNLPDMSCWTKTGPIFFLVLNIKNCRVFNFPKKTNENKSLISACPTL